MEPIAVGFMVMIGASVVMGILVGAVGGAVVWRTRCNLALGGLLTLFAFALLLVEDHHWKLTWLTPLLSYGAPALVLTFLVGTISAHWLEARTALRPTWTALAALGISLGAGLLFLWVSSLEALISLALVIDGCLILLLILSRWLVRRPDRG